MSNDYNLRPLWRSAMQGQVAGPDAEGFRAQSPFGKTLMACDCLVVDGQNLTAL
jgi:hypothetical protein